MNPYFILNIIIFLKFVILSPKFIIIIIYFFSNKMPIIFTFILNLNDIKGLTIHIDLRFIEIFRNQN